MTDKIQHPDTLQRFLFDGSPVRGALVRLDAAWQEVLSRRDYPAPIRNALGELLAAGQLLAANLKFDGTLVLQLQGKGALKVLVVECNADRTVRATAKWEGEVADVGLRDLVGEGGMFVITLDPKNGNDPWQGIVALEGGSIAEMLSHYMQRSEQLDTWMMLAADGETAAGLLLQRLPDGHGDADGWPRVQTLADTLTREELLGLDADVLLTRLYHEEQVRVFDAEPVSFLCSCSRERVGDMLKMLGGEEVGDIVLEQGSVEIGCDFCNQQYVFDEDDVRELFDYDVTEAVRQARH
ncbi:Hsp33 family molecular chaperone HslO [Crenobacter sp. SG2303]|uniref:33 kDa chaperonin n=1 Tax=Crenobacter oryzisoli TaxID=3056844 RepID=A0ABT7XJ88_9NEIS|nr:Hsp33 family molecular chaperone HslO [Crenobacter sp. SG2303]MDN0073805.1 Hsp33 family molecular chaperone HslO [Crenobacter sp. SG2303]